MKIKIYIVTYKKNEVLNKNLESLYSGAKYFNDFDVTVIANHPDIIIHEENMRDNLKVILNTTRMPNSWGYLSRDWNFCILDAFKTWKNEDNIDWIILAQNDVVWLDGWDDFVRNNKDYDFISQPSGDQAMILNINTIRKVGFFDERFTSIHCQEFDYFIRAIKNLGIRCSINDDHWNVKPFNSIGNVIINSNHSGDNINNQLPSINLCHNKYKIQGDKLDLSLLSKVKPLFKEINWYPFFWYGYDNEHIKNTFLDEYYNSEYNELNDYSDNYSISILHDINYKIDKIIESISWWIPIRKWRDNFRNKFKMQEEKRREEKRREEKRREEKRIPNI